MEIISLLAICAICGFCAKFSDEVAERKLRLFEAYAPALLYGILAAFAAAGGQASLFLAMAVASILSGKIDHPLHIAGLLAFAATIAFLPLATFSPFLFSLFLVAALLDELEIKSRAIALFADRRLLLPTSALVAGIWTGDFIPLLAIVLFDLGYHGGRMATDKLFPIAALGKKRRK